MPNSIVESDANKVEVDSITIAPTIAITDVIIIISVNASVFLIKLLSSILLKNVACISTPG